MDGAARELSGLKQPDKGPSYYRARIDLIEKKIADLNEQLKAAENKEEQEIIETRLRLFRWGMFPPGENEEQEITEFEKQHAVLYTNEPLSFEEITRYNTWFAMHPELVAGKEKIVTSLAFPVRVTGTKDDVIKTIHSVIKPQQKQRDMEAIKKRFSQLLKQSGKKYERHNGLSGLGALGEFVQSDIEEKLPLIKTLVEKSRKEKEYAPTDKLSFEEIVELYNEGISFEEIQAWVWYKRSIGVPMTGWEKYYLPSTGNAEITEQIITTQETVIKDNYFRDIYSVPAGKVLGKPVNKTHEYDKVTYQIFRDAEGLKWVNKAHIRIEKTDIQTDPQALYDLVLKGCLFYLDGELLPYPLYAYGNMYERELQLERDKAIIIEKYSDEVYKRHVEIIKTARPEPLSVTNPDPKQRPKILAISEFASRFTISELKEETGVFLEEPQSLMQAFVTWLNSLGRDNFKEATAFDIVYYYIEGKKIMDKKLSKDKKAELKSVARNEGEALFEKFLFEALTYKDQLRLDKQWNYEFNAQSSIPYHKIPIGFEASARFKQFNLEIRPAQREAVAFMEALGSGLIAYDVGVGKTLSAIITLANALYSGKCKRPLIVVPSRPYDKWVKELIGFTDRDKNFVPGILSNTGITVNEWYNLGNDILQSIDITKPVPEKSITIVTYEGFKKIGFSEKIMDEMFYELANILTQSDVNASERDKEIDYGKYREKIGVGLKNTVADIDTLKFDYLVIDEAHRCKNIFDGVRSDEKGRKRFGLQGATSETGIKAFFLCNYIQRTYGRDVCLLTATPFSNSPLEIFSMLSLIAYHALREMNISNIKRFFELFVLETTELAVNYKEEMVMKDVIKRFNNRQVLQKLLYNHINYKTGEEANVKRPCKIVLPKTSTSENGRIIRLKPQEQIQTYLRMTPAQRTNQNAIVAAAHAASRTNNTAGIFKALNASLNNALSPFLYTGLLPNDYKEFVEESPKIKYTLECIRSVKQYHEQHNESISGQVIYMNRGRDYFQYIKEYLEKEVGYKTNVKWGRTVMDEVEIIDSSVSETAKDNITDAFLEGVVKVIIGTATIREGIDLQKYGTVIYNCYPDWNPTDLRQLEGRIWRQGNEFGFVRIVIPLVQDSMDVFVFQKLEEKTERINDIWYRGDRGNVLDMESIDPEEIKLALITNVEAIAEVKQKTLVKEQQRKLENVVINMDSLKVFNADYSEYKHYQKLCMQTLQRWRGTLGDYSYIKKPLTKEELKKYDKELRDIISRNTEVFNEISAFLEAVPQKDKELLRLGRRLKQTQDNFESEYLFNYFKEYLSKVKKAEKNILRPKGFALEDDLKEVMEQYKQEKLKIEGEIKRLKSKEFFEELLNEVREKKSAMQIEGKSIGERVQEFARLNYLLSYKFTDIDSDNCPIPSPESERPPVKEKKKNLDLLKMKMRMKLLLYEQEQQGRQAA